MLEADLVRPDVLRPTVDASQFGVVQRPLSIGERIYNIGAVRKLAILVLLAAAWEIYARWLHNDLLFPTFGATLEAFVQAILSGGLLGKAWTSIKVLLIGYAAGIALAAVLTTVAISSRIGTDFLETLTSMFNPLPAIALLPLALIWFGLGNGSLVFVLIHSVLWAVALNTHSGFLSVSNTLRMVGRNYGLHGLSYVGRILIPAAFPSILTGLKIGWAFAWRSLMAGELIVIVAHQPSLGQRLQLARDFSDAEQLLALMIVIFAVGIAFDSLFGLADRRIRLAWGLAGD
jgi:NitT/TauT family transport system permease protein